MSEETQKPVLISVLGCRSCEQVQLCVASHFLSDLNPSNCNAPEVEITLQNLYALLENPLLSKNCKRLDSVETLISELVACELPTASSDATAVFVDLTSAQQKRDCFSLVKVSRSLSNIAIVAATGPDLNPFGSGVRSVGEAAQHMLTELLHGVDGNGALNESIPVRAGVMVVQIQPSPSECDMERTSHVPPSSSSSPSSFLLLEHDMKALDACCLVHVQFLSAQRVQPPPPLFIHMATLAEKSHALPLEYLHAKGVNLSSIALCGNVISLANVSYFEGLLSQYPKFMLLIDCFGSVEKPFRDSLGDCNNYPCDENICQAVQFLISAGFVNRLIITSTVRSKLNLRNYGGPGYAHVPRSVVPRLLRLGISTEYVQQLTVSNLIALVTWYIPPPEIPVEKDTFQCFICNKKSFFGDHYEKFEFLYCTSACLREHAKRKWAK